MNEVIEVCVAAAAHVVEVRADWTCSDDRHAGVHVAWTASRGAACPLCERCDALEDARQAEEVAEDLREELSRSTDHWRDAEDRVARVRGKLRDVAPAVRTLSDASAALQGAAKQVLDALDELYG